MKKFLNLAFIACTMFVISCNNVKPEKTIVNLKAGIEGETGASAKYAVYSAAAAAEGYENISKLFAATSRAEQIHILNHTAVLTKLGEVITEIKPSAPEVKGGTVENLADAAKGETYEYTEMYPAFIQAAEQEKVQEAGTSFTWAMTAEKKHSELYLEAMDLLQTTGNDSIVSSTWYVCPKCGFIYKSIDGVDACEVCATKTANFETF